MTYLDQMYMRPPLLLTRAIEARDLNDHANLLYRAVILSNVILGVEGSAVSDQVLSQSISIEKDGFRKSSYLKAIKLIDSLKQMIPI